MKVYIFSYEVLFYKFIELLISTLAQVQAKNILFILYGGSTIEEITFQSFIICSNYSCLSHIILS